MSSTGRGGAKWARQVALCLATYGTTCHLCGLPGATTADHVVPKSKGGSDALCNLRPAHAHCNYSRQDRPLTDLTVMFGLKPTSVGVGFFNRHTPSSPRAKHAFSPRIPPKTTGTTQEGDQS